MTEPPVKLPEHVIMQAMRIAAGIDDTSADDIPREVNGTALNPGEEKMAEQVRPRFTLRRFDAVPLPTAGAYLVKGIIPSGGLSVIWGPPKCGKSFWTFDLTMHIARGEPYRGKRVRQGPVVYLALEGGHGFRARIEAYRRVHGITAAPFYLVTDRTDLVRDHEALIDAIRAQVGTEKPAIVGIDTLNRSLAGSESKDEDMAAYIRAADAIREAFECAVVIVHHCGVDGSRPRGHTSLTGAADAQIAISRDAAGNITAEVEWMKDGPEGERIVSSLERVDLEDDEDGEPVNSCVIVPVEGEPVRAPTTRKLSDRQKLALDALTECVIAHAEPAPAAYGLPPSVRPVIVSTWRDEVYRRGVLDRDAKSPREDFRRLKNSLHARELIGFVENLVWRV